MMRLHFVLPQLDPLYGMELAAVLVMRGLMEKGVEVSATVLSGPIPHGLDDLDLDHLNIGKRITRLAESVPPLRRRLRSLPPDAEIVSSGLWGTVPVGVALAGSRKSFVAWEHSLLPARVRLDRRVRMLARFARPGYMRPRLVIAVSEGVAQMVRRTLPGQMAVKIPNAVPAKDFIPPRHKSVDGRIRLVTTGAFRPYKNYSSALSALALLPDSFDLQLAGDGEQLELLKTQARELNLGSRVTFLGRVPDVQGVLSAADVLVHPSFSETFGFSLVEAADAGVPVAALPVAAIDEMIPHFVPGRMADDSTPAALAEAVRCLALEGRPTSSDFEKAWRARTAAFEPAEVSGQWIEALEQ